MVKPGAMQSDGVFRTYFPRLANEHEFRGDLHNMVAGKMPSPEKMVQLIKWMKKIAEGRLLAEARNQSKERLMHSIDKTNGSLQMCIQFAVFRRFARGAQISQPGQSTHSQKQPGARAKTAIS